MKLVFDARPEAGGRPKTAHFRRATCHPACPEDRRDGRIKLLTRKVLARYHAPEYGPLFADAGLSMARSRVEVVE